MSISPHNLSIQPSPLLRRCFCYMTVHVTCKLMCYKRARPHARCSSAMHAYQTWWCSTCANTVPCRTISTIEMIHQLNMPLQCALTSPCSCLMHTFPDYHHSALVITSNENACVTLHSQAIQVNKIHICIKVYSELTLFICLTTWLWAQRGRDSPDNALLPR